MFARFSWWGTLAFVHRWLGIAGCLLFILWFVSGIAMIYVRMPAVTPAERYARLPPIDPARIHVSPGEAAAIAGVPPTAAVHLTMLGDRPVYRFGGAPAATVFADHAEQLTVVSEADARDYAGVFAPEHRHTLGHAGMVEIPDQWTLQSRAHLPLHHVTLGDADGTELYVSSRTGEVVMETRRRERGWAYVGPVAHWLYLPILRRNGPLWTDVIIWSSIAGCVLCLTGLVAGLWRWSPFRRFSIRGAPAASPYVGWMKWHHYAGLSFGLITLTWTFSGLLSMGPFPLLSSEGVTEAQRRAVTGDSPGYGAITAADTGAAVRTAGAALTVKELSVATFRGATYWIASESPARRVIVPAAAPHTSMAAFARRDVEAAARDAAGGAPMADLTWLDRYDDYYYDRAGARPLPVLRARYDDAEGTWLYLDPGRGSIALVTRQPDRLNRWLYHGLHSLDFSWLAGRRPLWDIVVIVLSIGGIAGAATSLLPAWRRLRRHGRSLIRMRQERPD